jgi:hypothetical protein
VGYFITPLVTKPYTIGLMNWKGLERKRKWSHWDNLSEFAWKDRGIPRKFLQKSTSRRDSNRGLPFCQSVRWRCDLINVVCVDNDSTNFSDQRAIAMAVGTTGKVSVASPANKLRARRPRYTWRFACSTVLGMEEGSLTNLFSVAVFTSVALIPCYKPSAKSNAKRLLTCSVFYVTCSSLAFL